MKRTDLMKRLAKIAKAKSYPMLVTEGGDHTKVRIGDTMQPVPRHNEITAKAIIKKMEAK